MTLQAHMVWGAACVGLCAYYLLAEKVTVHEGYGWDGERYAKWVATIFSDLRDRSIPNYYIKRTLPSFLIALPVKLLGVDPTRDYILHSFAIANAICVWIAGVFWARACAAMGLSSTRTAAGALVFLVTFATIKLPSYEPVLTDLFAFASSTVILDFWLRNWYRRLTGVVILSMFIWPSAAMVGVVLVILPRGAVLTVGRYSKILPWAAPAAALGVAALAGYIALFRVPENSPQLIVRGLLPLSIVVAATYVYFVVRRALSPLAGPDFAIMGLNPTRALMAASALATVVLLQWLWAPNPIGYALTVRMLIAGSINKPGVFLVSDFNYYGSMILLFGLFSQQVFQKTAEIGLGFHLVVIFALALNLYPESRMILNVIPFITFAVVSAAPIERLTGAQWTLLGVTQLAVAKPWLTIRASESEFALTKLQEFPAQWFFSNFGPWLNLDMYLVQGCVALVALGLFGWAFRSPKQLR